MQYSLFHDTLLLVLNLFKCYINLAMSIMTVWEVSCGHGHPCQSGLSVDSTWTPLGGCRRMAWLVGSFSSPPFLFWLIACGVFIQLLCIAMSQWGQVINLMFEYWFAEQKQSKQVWCVCCGLALPAASILLHRSRSSELHSHLQKILAH